MARQNLSPVPPRTQQVVIPQDRPVYEVVEEAGFFGPNDHLYVAGAWIEWDEEPNLGLKPLNKLADEKMVEFLTKLDKLGAAKAEKEGKHYNGLLEMYERSSAFHNNPAQRDRVRQLNGAVENQTPLMGAKKQVDTVGLIDRATPPMQTIATPTKERTESQADKRDKK